MKKISADELNNDFAAGAMLRLIGLGLKRQGLDLPSDTQTRLTVQSNNLNSRIPFNSKRELLRLLDQRYGLDAIFAIGDAVQDATEEPILAALLAAQDPHDLIERFQRLERYIHSLHRVKVIESGSKSIGLKHVSLRTGSAPIPPETVLVWGLISGLLKRLGLTDVEVRFDQQTLVLRIVWQPKLQTLPTAPSEGRDILSAARQKIASDCAAKWTLPKLAERMKLSPRTLQRRLAESRTSFSLLYMQVRLAQAGQLLIDEPESAAQVGYRCGFADQAHFTRSFQSYTQLSPGLFRREFARQASDNRANQKR